MLLNQSIMDVDATTLRTLVSELPLFSLDTPTRVATRVFGYDCCYAIPKGRTCLGWWRDTDSGPACHLLWLDKGKGGIAGAERRLSSFDYTVAAGTIVSGIVVLVKSRTYFCITDIHQYGGKMLTDYDWSMRYSCISSLLSRLNPRNYTDQFVTFSMPVSAPTYKELSPKIKELPYDIANIRYTAKGWGPGKIRLFSQPKPSTEELTRVFTVIPRVEQDVYELRCIASSLNTRYAAVQTLAESIVLNKLFRRIRENDDIDLAEMSEDEEDFENVDPRKFVQSRQLRMECTYVKCLRKWRPLKVTRDPESTNKDVIQCESNYSTR